MGIEQPELVDLVHKLEDLEQKLCSHPLHKVCLIVTFQLRNAQSHFYLMHFFFAIFVSQSDQSEQQLSWYQRKAELNHEIQQLKSKMRDSQVG